MMTRHATDRANDNAPRFSGIREVVAGCSGALAALPPTLTIGLLAFAPLGAAAPQIAVFAAFVTAGIGGLAHSLLSRTRMPVAGPSSATALTLATLVAQLLADPRLAPTSAPGLQDLVALCALAVLLSGVLQIAFALLGWARLARVVPQPVLAGFMNGTALLIALTQLPLLLGLPLNSPLNLASLRGVHPTALSLGLGTAAAIWLLARRWPRLPAPLLALLAGTLAHAGVSSLLGADAAGAVVGKLPLAWHWQSALAPLLQQDALTLLRAHGAQIGLTALALATVGALESSLNVRAVDQLLNARHDSGGELIAIGCGNVVCGLFGGVPLAATRTRALATLQAGGRGRVSVRIGPIAICALYVLGGPLLALLPLPVLAGLMLMVALGLADRWTGRLLARWWAGDRSRDLTPGLALVALVTGTMVGWGMTAGIVMGVLLSLLSFAQRMKSTFLHDRYKASTRPSRRVYPPADEARLRPLRESIVVFELDGALFFGSGDRLVDDADALGADCSCLVLDLRRVGAIDESGAIALQTAVLRAELRGIRVKLAGLAPGSGPALALQSFAPTLPHWPDADRAIEAAEHRLLGGTDVAAMAEVQLAESSLLRGLDASQVAVVTAHLQVQHLATGEVLFTEGEPADRLYVVGQGSISVLSLPDKNGRTQRYLSVSPGMMLGETAMLDGGGRTAGAVADAPTVVHALTLSALDEIGRTHPEVSIRIHRNIALHLSQRLRGAAQAWRASAR